MEKQIEKMAKTMCGNGMKDGNCATDDSPCYLECVYGTCAERLYNAGYRKQSEVIDDFAKALLDAFPEGNRDARCPAIYYDDYMEIVEEAATKMKGATDERAD